MTNYNYILLWQTVCASFEPISNKRHHKLDSLCHLPLSSITDDKIRPPPLFQPRVENNFRPPTSSLNHTYRKMSTPTSFWTIRTLPNGPFFSAQSGNEVGACSCRNTGMGKMVIRGRLGY